MDSYLSIVPLYFYENLMFLYLYMHSSAAGNGCLIHTLYLLLLISIMGTWNLLGLMYHLFLTISAGKLLHSVVSSKHYFYHVG